jgi:hypothetical protein
LSLKDPKAIAMTARSGLNDLAGDNIVRSDLVVEPQPSRRNEKACQEKDVYWPLQQFGPLGDENHPRVYTGRPFKVIYRKLVREISRA